jgi:integrase
MKKLKYIKEYTSNGKTYYYFRKPNQKQIQIEGEFGTPQFLAHYSELLDNKFNKKISAAKIKKELTLNDLINDYQNDLEFLQYKESTKNNYLVSFRRLTNAQLPNDTVVNLDLGNLPINTNVLTVELGQAILKRFLQNKTPSAGNEVMKHFKKLLNFAKRVTKYKIEYNPFMGFGNTPTDIDNQRSSPFRLKTNGSQHIWSDDEFNTIFNCADLGIQTAMLIARYLCQSKADVLDMKWNRYKNGSFRFQRIKTNAPIFVPARPELISFLENLPKVGLYIVMDHNYNNNKTYKYRAPLIKPYSTRHFHRKLDQAITKAGYDKYKFNFHGLRYKGLGELSEAGCTTHEIMAISGHKNMSMVEKYTKKANRELNAISGINKVIEFKRKVK